jgi:hypothetical protein
MAQDPNQDVSNADIMAMLGGELLPSDIVARRAAKKREKAVGRRQREIEAELEKFSTGKLLKMRTQNFCGEVVFLGEDGYLKGKSKDHYCADATEAEYDEQRAQSLALYAVLARRPHVPNKIEGHNARKEAATQHHGPKKAGGRRKRFGAEATPVKKSARRLEQEERKFDAWFTEECKKSPWMARNRNGWKRVYQSRYA